MKYDITKLGYLSPKARLRVVLKWLVYALVLLILYSINTSGFGKRWQPLLMIPLALAVAMYESELSGAVFGVFCGLICDLATGNIFGYCALILLPCCLCATILVRNFIKQNVLNYLWMTAVSVLAIGGFEYFFKFYIWEYEGVEIIFKEYTLPTYLSTVILSPVIYYIVHRIHDLFEKKQEITAGESDSEENEE